MMLQALGAEELFKVMRWPPYGRKGAAARGSGAANQSADHGRRSKRR
jgi:hypothetical protein